MSKKRKILKHVITIVITVTMLFATNSYSGLTLQVMAEENSTDIQQSSSTDKNFVPMRSFIPRYLSFNSSVQSNTIKGLWEKLFYEESINPDWSKKYYAGADSDYIGLGGMLKSFNGINFAADSSDFDAFFGNTLEANPEFLGELLSIDGYAKLQPKYYANNAAQIQNLMQEIIFNKMSNPSVYKYFAKSFARLTADGLYIGDSNNSDNNILKNLTYQNQSFDIWALTCLASLYEGNGNETYLSQKQVSWLQSYQKWLYDNYVDSPENSLATKYASIYELIARSTYASNNYRGKGQEFFNHVVNSKKGIGVWLNQNDNISISGLEEVDDLVSLFNTSSGWCGGVKTNCRNHDSCISKALLVDKLALAVHDNSVAMNYIQNNDIVYTVHGAKVTDQNSWLFRYHIKHSHDGIPMEPMQKVVTIVSGGNRATASSSVNMYRGHTDGVVVANASATGRVYIKDILYDEKTNPKGAKNPQNITVTYGGEGQLNCQKASTNNSYSEATYTMSPSISVNDPSITYVSVGANSYKFDLTNIVSEEQLRNAYVQITAYAGSSCNSRGATPEGDNTYTVYCAARVGFYDPIVEDKPDDCDLNGHDFDRASIEWSDDYDQATITYSCSHNRIHHSDVQITTNITSEMNDGFIVYTAVDNRENTYTKRVKINGQVGDGFTNISLSPENASGYYKTITNSEVIVPGGAQSDMCPPRYTSAQVRISGNIKSGSIPLGASKIVFHYVVSEHLEDLKIYIYSENGKIIGQAVVPSGSFSGSVTAIIFSNSDLSLRGSYVAFSGSASSTHWRHDYWYSGQPAPATATLGITGMTVYY